MLHPLFFQNTFVWLDNSLFPVVVSLSIPLVFYFKVNQYLYRQSMISFISSTSISSVCLIYSSVRTDYVRWRGSFEIQYNGNYEVQLAPFRM